MFSDPKEMSRFRLFMRYLASAEHAWNRAVADFEKEQKARLKLERKADMREACFMGQDFILQPFAIGLAPLSAGTTLVDPAGQFGVSLPCLIR